MHNKQTVERILLSALRNYATRLTVTRAQDAKSRIESAVDYLIQAFPATENDARALVLPFLRGTK